VPARKPFAPRKLLVAAVGVASINYVAVACGGATDGGSPTPPTSGNLPAPMVDRPPATSGNLAAPLDAGRFDAADADDSAAGDDAADAADGGDAG